MTGGGAGTTGGGSGPTIDVAGKVITRTGVAVPSATVAIVGKGTTTSDSQGNFAFSGVTPPYTIAATAVGGAQITVVIGVTRADPVVRSNATASTAPNSASVSGLFSGSATTDGGVARRNLYLFESPEVATTNTLSGDDPGYVVNGIVWPSALTTVTGNVHALQVHNGGAGGLPSSFTAYGTSANVTLVDNATVSGKNIAGTQVTAGALAGTVTVPQASSLQITTTTFSVRLGHGSILLGTDSVAVAQGDPKPFSFVTPAIPDSSITLTSAAVTPAPIRSSTFTRYGAPANENAANFTLAAPPQLNMPTDFVTGIDLATQTFSWSPMDPAGLYSVTLSATPPTVGNAKTFTIYTESTDLKFPSPTDLGLPAFANDTTFTWFVTGTGGATAVTVNDLVGPFVNATDLPAAGDVWSASSEQRVFKNQL